MTSSKYNRRALQYTFLTGAAGLLYEVTWHKMLSNIIGSQSQATALVLAVFLGGLGLGYWFFSKNTKSTSNTNLLKRYGIIETCIGAWAILSVVIYLFIWNSIGILGLSSSAFIWREFLLATLLVGPGSFMMGATLPLLTEALNSENTRKTHAAIYAVNTAGALLGCLLTGFFLLPVGGVVVATLLGSIVNLLAGKFFISISKSYPGQDKQVEVDAASAFVPLSYKIQLFATAFIAGFYALTFQAIMIRLAGLNVGSSEYAFTIIVATFLALIALGAWVFAGRNKARTLWSNQAIVAMTLLLLYFTVPLWPYCFHVLRILFDSSGTAFYFYQAGVLIFFGLLMFFPVTAMGATLPLIFSLLNDNRHKAETVGWVYGLNTFGTVLGAYIGGYVLFYNFDLNQIFKICFLLSTLTVILSFKVEEKKIRLVPAFISIGLVIVSLSTLTYESWDLKRLALGIYRERQATPQSFSGPGKFYNQYKDVKLISYEDGPNTSAAVFEFKEKNGVSRSLLVNGKSDGNTSGDAKTMKLLAHIPALLTSSKSENAAVIGFGTGLTVSSLALYDSIKSIDTIDISPAVRNAAGFFDQFNSNASTNPKVNWIIADAYRVLGGINKEYGVIISQPSNPWISGVERLYTPEFYSAVKDRLAENGVFMQWLALYGTSFETLKMIVSGFNREFSANIIFQSGNDVLLLGSLKPISTANLKQKFNKEPIKKTSSLLE